MARYKYQGTFKDGNGAVVGAATTSNATDGVVYVYLAGGTTAATVYAAESGGSSVASVETDDDGHFYFWVDDTEYDAGQRFKISLTHADFETKTYDDLDIIPQLTKSLVSVTDATMALTAVKHANRIITADRAAGIAFTLPEATGTGDVYTIVLGTAMTSGSLTVTTADTTNADIAGWAKMYDTDVVEVWEVYPSLQATGNDIITMNRTTTGGVQPGVDSIVLTDIKTDLWMADVTLSVPAGSNPATPFSST